MKILKKAFEFACVGAILGVREYLVAVEIDPASGVSREEVKEAVKTLDGVWEHVKMHGSLTGYGEGLPN